jgi:hypothetical protein
VPESARASGNEGKTEAVVGLSRHRGWASTCGPRDRGASRAQVRSELGFESDAARWRWEMTTGVHPSATEGEGRRARAGVGPFRPAELQIGGRQGKRVEESREQG